MIPHFRPNSVPLKSSRYPSECQGGLTCVQNEDMRPQGVTAAGSGGGHHQLSTSFPLGCSVAPQLGVTQAPPVLAHGAGQGLFGRVLWKFSMIPWVVLPTAG